MPTEDRKDHKPKPDIFHIAVTRTQLDIIISALKTERDSQFSVAYGNTISETLKNSIRSGIEKISTLIDNLLYIKEQ